MPIELTEALLSQAAGWDVMKLARAYLQQGQVLSSYWAPPLLRGVVQAEEISFRASLVINSPVEMENLCTCRDARQWGRSAPMSWPSACTGSRGKRPATPRLPPVRPLRGRLPPARPETLRPATGRGGRARRAVYILRRISTRPSPAAK